MRLIDADKVNETIDRFIGYLDEDMILRIKMKISKIPTVDRPHGECNQCRHYKGGCLFWGIGGVLSSDYCSRFEKEGDAYDTKRT